MKTILKASLTSGTLFILGDVLNQCLLEPYIEKRDWNWNVRRTLHFGLLGAVLHGPWFSVGFRLLDRTFPQTHIYAVVSKAALGQIVLFGPFLALFLGAKSLLEEDPVDFTHRYMEIFKAGCYVWPVANMINFRFVPSHLRLFYINFVGIGWNTFLSLKTHSH